MQRFLFVLAPFALVFAMGCHPPPVPTMPIENASRALRLHASLRHEVRSVSTVARVEQRGRQGRIRGTVWGLIALPDRLRFDVMTSLGPVATLTSDGDDFALLDQREGRFAVGPTCATNVGRFLGVAIEATEVATLLVGGVPFEARDGATITPIHGGYDMDLPTGDGRARVRLHIRAGDELLPPVEQHLRLARLEVRGVDDRVRLVITYDDYRVVEDPEDTSETPHGIAMPFVVRIEDRANDAELLVRFTEISVNGELAPEAFSQTPPSGMVIERAECD